MTAIERHQIPVYFAAVLRGSIAGLLLPDSASVVEAFIWPLVGILLYFTFLQVPLIQFRQALTDVRFLGAMLTANFVFVPLALALPPEWKLAVAVIVIQAFVEMLGMLTFIRFVPGWLLPDTTRSDKAI